MSAPMQNGRAATEVTTPPDATDTVQGVTTAYPEDNRLALLREADENAYSECYVVVDVAGDVCAINYAPRWNAYLAGGEA
jgi:hypothetical protein